MPDRTHNMIFTLVLAIAALLGPGSAMALDFVDLSTPPVAHLPALDRFSEDLFDEFARAADQTITFEVVELDRGPMSELENKTFRELLQMPGHRIEASLSGLAIENVRFLNSTTPSALPSHFDATTEGFDQIDYPTVLGSFRKLKVSTTIGGVTQSHQALEFCWPELEQCRLLDPAFPLVQSMVENRIRLFAIDWRPKLVIERFEKPAVPEQSADIPACRFAESADWQSLTLRWETWSVDYKDAFGEIDLSKEFGQQEVGVRCEGDSEATCRPVYFGSSQPASCESHDEAWTCGPCTDVFQADQDGTSALARAQCSHRLIAPKGPQPQSAKTENGTNASRSESNTVQTSPFDFSGGKLEVSCVWEG